MKKILALLALIPSLAIACELGQQPIKVALYIKGGFYYEGKGLDVDLFKEIKKRTGCEFEFESYERAEIWRRLNTGESHVATVGTPTPEREKIYHFVTYSRQKNVLLLNKSVDPTIMSIREFVDTPGLKFCTVKGFKHGAFYDPFIDQLEAMGRVERFPDQVTVFKMLASGHCQGQTAYPISYNKFVRELKLLDNVRQTAYVPEDVAIPNGLILTKKVFDDQTAKKWRDLMQQIRVEGKLYRLHLPYLKAYDAAIAAGE